MRPEPCSQLIDGGVRVIFAGVGPMVQQTLRLMRMDETGAFSFCIVNSDDPEVIEYGNFNNVYEEGKHNGTSQRCSEHG